MSPSRTLPDQASSSSAGQRSCDKQQIKALLASLAFDQMDSRHNSIHKTYGKTCEWLSTTPEYVDWLEPAKLEQHHGFLWIKGKPGAGKSTLMKSALHKAQNTENMTFLSFFFHARGDELEKSTVGMYRSLVLQLLEKIPRLQSVFNSLGRAVRDISIPQWSANSLKTLFEQAFLNLGRSPLTCFIDALDECDESEVRDMMSFFEALGEIAVSEGMVFRVCLSSRHYPHITIAKGLTLDLGQQEGHSKDIINYVKGKLKIGTDRFANRIRSQLIEKASGIFIWVVLVVQILNKEFDHGNRDELWKRLQHIPDDLNDLFQDILTRDNRDATKLLLCTRWILFAKQPLTPQQLYLAILVTVNNSATASWRFSEINDANVRRSILSSSKGLAEVSTSTKNPKVQFIHESVREFFLKQGLTGIWPEHKGDFKAESHEQLKQCCLEYLSICQARLDFGPLVPKSEEQKKARRSTESRFPLLEYAFRNVLYHADKAAAGGVNQTAFLQSFDITGWLKFEELFEQNKRRIHLPTTSLLYILAERNSANLIKYHPNNLSCFEVEEGDERYGMPILAAVATNSHQAVQALLKAQAEAEPPTSPLRSLCDHYDQNEAKQNYSTRTFRFSKKKTRFVNLVVAGNEQVATFATVSERIDLNVNWRGMEGADAVSHAARNGYDTILPLVLDKGASLHERDDATKTPLHYAARRGQTATALLLLGRGARVGALTANYQSSLHLAAQAGHVAMVQLLLDNGSSVEWTCKLGRTALHLAAKTGHEAVARMLLDRGANALLADCEGKTPLHFAAIGGNEQVARLLLDQRANALAADNSGETPLHLAVRGSNEAVVQLLLGRGANIYARNRRERTPYYLATLLSDGNATKKTMLEQHDRLEPGGWR